MTTRAVEDYLKCILVEEQGLDAGRVSTGRIAQSLGLAPGTVTAMLQALAEAGRVDYAPYGGVRLTADGRRQALHVLRRHRLIELFLVEVLGFDWSEVHDEAERLEHAVSDRLVDRIPDAQGELRGGELSPLDGVAIGGRFRVARVADQDAAFLRSIENLGLAPGARFRLVAREAATDTVELELSRGRRVSLGSRAAAKLWVAPAQRSGAKRARQ